MGRFTLVCGLSKFRNVDVKKKCWVFFLVWVVGCWVLGVSGANYQRTLSSMHGVENQRLVSLHMGFLIDIGILIPLAILLYS